MLEEFNNVAWRETALDTHYILYYTYTLFIYYESRCIKVFGKKQRLAVTD